MPWELTATSAVGFGTLLVYAVLTLVGAWNWESRCGPEVTVMFAVVGLSALAYSIQIGYDVVSTQVFWWELTFALSTAAPFLWLVFVVQYVSRAEWLTPRRAALFALEPTAMVVAIATNPIHGLVWTVPAGTTASAGSAIELAFGPLYYGHLVLAYLVVMIGMGLILLVGIRWSLVYWKQVIVLLVAPIPPFLSNIAFMLGESPVPHLDLTPFTFALTGVFIVLGLYQFDLLERVPIARQQALQVMGDGLVVLDADRTVVQVDDITRRILDPPPRVGRPIDSVFPDTPFEQLHGTTVTDGNNLAYDIRIAELTDERGDRIGYALMLRDVTSRYRYEQRLEVANRVLRHNLRNDMNVVRGYAEMVASGSEADAGRAARSILDRTEGLLTVSDKARKVSELDDSHALAPNVHDVTAIVAGVVHQARGSYSDIEFTFDSGSHVDAKLTDAGAVATAVEEVIELLAGQPGTTEIALVVDERDDVVIRIESDGPGIPEVDRETLSVGSETPLQHAEGLGMWLAYWCVTENAGTLSFGDGSENKAVDADAASVDAAPADPSTADADTGETATSVVFTLPGADS
ncbi:histidine kinase N-terminal 7TM domain-containing protein [Halobellus salinisoli]|uniref:histidine kinase N-terminal 7TM domain-containing protein n=1 Tax=Halobellus salinisoli TaxID=3108500 RepID=UPI0030088AA3